VNEPDEPPRQETIRSRAYEVSQEPGTGTPEENWLRAELELSVVHDYDTIDRDLERLGITLSRIPLEAGVTWRLQLPRGEQIEAWEPGNNGLAPPAEVASLIDGVIAGRKLIPMAPRARGSDRAGARPRRAARARPG
jgi:hypothetical protein